MASAITTASTDCEAVGIQGQLQAIYYWNTTKIKPIANSTVNVVSHWHP
jgi:hypothetical protein